MARKTTIAAFEGWIADEANVVDVLERLALQPLHKVAVVVKQPYTCLYAYFSSNDERAAQYQKACEARVSRRADEVVDIADDVRPDRDHVSKAKLQIDARVLQAKAYNPERWGDKLQVEKSVTMEADAALLGRAAELLERLSVRREKLIEGGEVVGDVSPPALPASRPPGGD